MSDVYGSDKIALARLKADADMHAAALDNEAVMFRQKRRAAADPQAATLLGNRAVVLERYRDRMKEIVEDLARDLGVRDVRY